MKLFDLDGTLLDTNGLWRDIDVRFLNKRGIEWTEEYNQGVIHAIFPIAAQFTKDFCHLDETPEEIMAEWLEMAKEGYARTLPVKEGVMAYLNRCRQNGERMALFTSAEPSLCRAALADRGFDKYLTQVVFAQQLGMEKRSPAAFREAARRLGVKPEEITFYDDSPVACRGAREAGFTVIGVYDDCFAEYEDEMREFCDGYIRSFMELL
ncbi:MAG: HAD family phosphatase [Oscillospiraceae bacterium]|nr:HAD family phosphatase [Oscillospiraceae bacterium]